MKHQLYCLFISEQLHTPMNKIGLFTDFSLDLFGEDSSDPHVKIKKLTKSTERSLHWQADTFPPSQEFPHNLRKIKSHYLHHYSPLLLSTLQYANEQHVHLISGWPILISSSHQRLVHPNCFSAACFVTNVPHPLHTPLYTFQFT